MVTSILLAKPASASSTDLSTTSYTRWCSPISPLEPMYMAGRKRTASMPPRTFISSAVYSPFPLPPFFPLFCSDISFAAVSSSTFVAKWTPCGGHSWSFSGINHLGLGKAFKLLKFKPVRGNLCHLLLYHRRSCFGPGERVGFRTVYKLENRPKN